MTYKIQIRTATAHPEISDWDDLGEGEHDTLADAISDILTLVLDSEEAVSLGDMSDLYTWEDFRVIHNGNVVASFPGDLK